MDILDPTSESSRKGKAVRGLVLAACVCMAVLVAGIALHVSDLGGLPADALSQQSLEGIDMTVSKSADGGKTDKKTSEKKLSAPTLMRFIGADQATVLSMLGEGATVTSSRQVKDVDSAVAQVVTIALTSQSADLASGTPTVTLAFNADGVVIQAGFSVNMGLIGYGSISFIDAVENMHVIENLLTEAGLAVPAGSVKMPESKAEYAVYGADGITLAKEQYTFAGTVEQAGREYDWTGQLTYDYTQANASGNLAYTVRIVTVNIIAQS